MKYRFSDVNTYTCTQIADNLTLERAEWFKEHQGGGTIESKLEKLGKVTEYQGKESSPSRVTAVAQG